MEATTMSMSFYDTLPVAVHGRTWVDVGVKHRDVHDVCLHFLRAKSSEFDVIQTVRNVLPRSIRTRVRLHGGSSLEMDYALRTFGIDLARQLFYDGDPHTNSEQESIEQDIHRRQQLDHEWWQHEAPYRDPTSPIALFPYPQDIILGRNKTVAVTWSGNILYHKVIQDRMYRYIEAQNASSVRINKTLIAVEVLHVLHNEYRSRFFVPD